MTRTELQELGQEIAKRQRELLDEHLEEFYIGRYSVADAWEEAVKEICLLR